jgi:hypothetical protein
MADPGIQVLETDPEFLSGSAIPFRFEISWLSLTEPAKSSGAPAKIPEAAAASRAETLSPIHWAPAQPVTSPKDTPAPASVENSGPLVPAPSFASGAESRSPLKWIAVAAFFLVVALVFAAARRIGQSSAPEEIPAAKIEMGEAGWTSEWTSDFTGPSLGRQLSLYRPSLSMADYRLEFTGQIGRRSLGWVFRTADSRNYYVGKLQAPKPGALLILTRFAVIRGVEDSHIQVSLPQVSSAGLLKVRLDAKGSRFTIRVQNQVVADWQDDRLKTGGAGFLNERDERGQVESVQISFQKAGVPQ